MAVKQRKHVVFIHPGELPIGSSPTLRDHQLRKIFAELVEIRLLLTHLVNDGRARSADEAG